MTTPESSRNVGSRSSEIARLYDVKTFVDKRGKLSVLEGAEIPFQIRRIYYLYEVPDGELRGAHGHVVLQQCFLCLNGSVKIDVDDGFTEETFILDNPGRALFVPSMRWRHLSEFSPGATVMVLASAPYDKDDYIFEREEFHALAKKEAAAK